MKFTQHRAGGANLICRNGPDFIQVGEQELRASCLVSATSITPWSPRSVEELTAESCAVIFELRPEVGGLATGATQKFPRAALRAEFASRRIGLEVMEIGAASRTYNVLVSEERRAVAAVI